MLEKRNNYELRKKIEKLEFKSLILKAQQNLSLDGILVSDADGILISMNTRFITMWQMPQYIVDEVNWKKRIQFIVDQLENPEQFIAKVEYLLKEPLEMSRDILKIKDGRIFHRYSAPISGIKESFKGRVWFFRDITEITCARNQLQSQNINLEKEVKQRTDQLVELNSLLIKREREVILKKEQLTVVNNNLRAMLHVLEEEKREIKEKSTANISEALLPLLQLLKKPSSPKQQLDIVETMEVTLRDLSSAMNYVLNKHQQNFTPAEIRVANFIKVGKTSKEIADLLFSSERTIEGHRASIRKKLALKRHENLQSILLSLS